MSWFLLAPLDLLVSLLAYPLAPIIVLLTDGATPPAWAWPWMTDDNPIDGDGGHWERWPNDGTTKRVIMRRIAWLWRNRGYGFSTFVTGRMLAGPTYFWGNRLVSDRPMSAGFCWAYNRGTWGIYAFVPWLPFFKCGLRVRLGWKIPLSVDCPNERAMLVTHINPIKGYQ